MDGKKSRKRRKNHSRKPNKSKKACTNPGSSSKTSLTDSIFGVSSSKPSSALTSLFDGGPSKPSKKGFFDKPTQPSVPSKPSKAVSQEEDPETIRKIIAQRKERAEDRPLLTQALDFPGVFSNEAIDGEVGFFRIDDENERAKETADAVRDHGLCVIRDAIEQSTIEDLVLPTAKALQEKLHKALTSKNIHHSKEFFRFKEAASRCLGRTDVVFDELESDQVFQEAILKNSKVYPVVQNLLGGTTEDSIQLVYAGLLFSYPGSCDQPWHQDGTPLFPEIPMCGAIQANLPPYAINVFFPLESLSLEQGPTEFIPNSHKWESSKEPSEENTIVAPLLQQGDALLYDYRVCHRGTANLFPNKSGIRRILYLMYARPWFTDHVNFDYTKSAKSLFDKEE